MTLTCLCQPWGSLRGIKSPKSKSVPSLKKRHRLPKIATDEQRWIGNDQIWSRVARGWLWHASGNPGVSLRGIKSPKSISVPSLKKRHRLPKIATDEQRWIGNDQIWYPVATLDHISWVLIHLSSSVAICDFPIRYGTDLFLRDLMPP